MIKTVLSALLLALLFTGEVSAQRYAPDRNLGRNCTQKCWWKCDGVGAFGRCVGSWYKACNEPRCSGYGHR